ncbi:MAG: hypothetical protein IPJ88_02035 [Myxococcales bacterium]|nr:MAG: hypothetical protein IPJ88_02035 [Myxococcales bacterium]
MKTSLVALLVSSCSLSTDHDPQEQLANAQTFSPSANSSTSALRLPFVRVFMLNEDKLQEDSSLDPCHPDSTPYIRAIYASVLGSKTLLVPAHTTADAEQLKVVILRNAPGEPHSFDRNDVSLRALDGTIECTSQQAIVHRHQRFVKSKENFAPSLHDVALLQLEEAIEDIDPIEPSRIVFGRPQSNCDTPNIGIARVASDTDDISAAWPGADYGGFSLGTIEEKVIGYDAVYSSPLMSNYTDASVHDPDGKMDFIGLPMFSSVKDCDGKEVWKLLGVLSYINTKSYNPLRFSRIDNIWEWVEAKRFCIESGRCESSASAPDAFTCGGIADALNAGEISDQKLSSQDGRLAFLAYNENEGPSACPPVSADAPRFCLQSNQTDCDPDIPRAELHEIAAFTPDWVMLGNTSEPNGTTGYCMIYTGKESD